MKLFLSSLMVLAILAFCSVFPILLFSDLEHGTVGWRLLGVAVSIDLVAAGVVGMCSVKRG